MHCTIDAQPCRPPEDQLDLDTAKVEIFVRPQPCKPENEHLINMITRKNNKNLTIANQSIQSRKKQEKERILF
jgi:hypothetical protein